MPDIKISFFRDTCYHTCTFHVFLSHMVGNGQHTLKRQMIRVKELFEFYHGPEGDVVVFKTQGRASRSSSFTSLRNRLNAISPGLVAENRSALTNGW